jgi:hypothetical protein
MNSVSVNLHSCGLFDTTRDADDEADDESEELPDFGMTAGEVNAVLALLNAMPSVKQGPSGTYLIDLGDGNWVHVDVAPKSGSDQVRYVIVRTPCFTEAVAQIVWELCRAGNLYLNRHGVSTTIVASAELRQRLEGQLPNVVAVGSAAELLPWLNTSSGRRS